MTTIYADYLWLIGKTYLGRHPKPASWPDGRTITVVDVRPSACFVAGICVELKDDTGRSWCTPYAKAVVAQLKGD